MTNMCQFKNAPKPPRMYCVYGLLNIVLINDLVEIYIND